MRIQAAAIAAMVLLASWGAPAAVAGDEIAGPRVVEITPVGEGTLEVRVQHGTLTVPHQEPYVAQPTDKPTPWKYHNWMERDSKVIGTLVGPKKDVLYVAPKFQDEPLDDKAVAEVSHYQLVCTSGADAAFAQPVTPVAAYHKARATDLVRTDIHKIEGPRELLVYLTFPTPLKSGAVYQLSFPQLAPAVAATEYRHDPRQARSEAVHVSQVGFRPDDPLKVAFLSLWMGDGKGMKYTPELQFDVLRTSDGTSAFHGTTEMALGVDETELPGKVNHNGADVWKMDFSKLKEPGEYRVFVEDVGCSYPFRIGEDVWQKADRIAMRGLYHQRSGIALGPPYTEFVRPRPMHPDDGVAIHLNKAAYVEPGNPSSPEALFKRLDEGKSEATTGDAWGGYQDAGDWDRRAEHLVAARCLLDLAMAYPAYAKSMNLNIPESQNKLPDMLDEALWGIDFFRRMQQPDGSVPSGVESAEHPKVGEGSWQESHPIYRYAPDPWATALYAATAAEAARALQPYDAEMAKGYRDSALKAMECIEAQQAAGKLDGYDNRVVDARNLAAVQLYILSGDARWHEVFKSTSAFSKAQGRTAKWEQFDQGEAIFAYLQLPKEKTDATIRKWGTQAVTNEADELIKAGQATAFGWTGSPAIRIGWGRLTSPRTAIPLIYAYRLTGNAKYVEAMLRACQYATGANPLNLCFTTGVGGNWPKHVFKQDAEVTGQAVPEGITPLGPMEWMLCNNWWLNPKIRTYPDYKTWPTCEMYIDAGIYTVTCEPTIHNSMTPTFYMWGHLAARPAIAAAGK